MVIFEIVDLGGWLVRDRYFGRNSVQKYNNSEKGAKVLG